jgi:hypothetical protein
VPSQLTQPPQARTFLGDATDRFAPKERTKALLVKIASSQVKRAAWLRAAPQAFGLLVHKTRFKIKMF